MANHSTAGAGALFLSAERSIRGGAVAAEVGAAGGDHVTRPGIVRAGSVVGGAEGAATERRQRQHGSRRGEDDEHEGGQQQGQSLHGISFRREAQYLSI